MEKESQAIQHPEKEQGWRLKAMCDETTALKERPVSAATGPASAFETPQAGLVEAMVEMPTGDGTAEAFFVHPAEGRHPGVIFWPDAIGLRDAKKTMARRLASSGYAVLAVNQYYRNARLPLGIRFDTFRDEKAREKVMPLIAALNPEAVTRDAAAYAAFLDAQGAVDTRRGIGTQGYCMGGSLAFRTAAAVPGRITAVASFHGGGLVTEAPDSPHQTMAATRAAYLILPGRDDDAGQPEAKDVLRQTAEAHGRPAEIEVYNADHGWCVLDAPMYDEPEAERAWARLLELYKGL
jgi:carboxymethylenebutenolidase